ncbi:MAG: hypothetical protein ACE5HA_01465 [Anaerolineae bacterium]
MNSRKHNRDDHASTLMLLAPWLWLVATPVLVLEPAGLGGRAAPDDRL